MKTTIRLITASIMMVTLTACNTMQGVGNDLSSAGNALSKSARKVGDKL